MITSNDPRRRHHLVVLAALGLLLLLGGVLTSCSDDDDAAPTEPTATADTATGDTATADTATGDTATADTATSSPEGTPTAVPSATEVDRVRVYLLSGEVLTVGGRTIDPGADPVVGAVEALFDGVADGFETDFGWSSAIPDGSEVAGVTVADGTATVDVNEQFQSGGGSASMTARVAQLVFTLTQFDGIDTVDIAIDGTIPDGIGGEGVQASGLTREGFLQQDLAGAPTPIILVESPTAGETVTVGEAFTISGLSNTFEANVRYTVTDPEGLILIDEFTTATAGTGTWGTFSVQVTMPEVDRPGVASVIVFEESAEDGRPINVVEVPVTVATAD